MEEASGDNWSYKMCKAPIKSSPSTNKHPVFYRLDALPVAQPTVSIDRASFWHSPKLFFTHSYQVTEFFTLFHQLPDGNTGTIPHSDRFHIPAVGVYGKYRPRTHEHHRPVRSEDRPDVSEHASRRKRADTPLSGGHKLMRGLTTKHQNGLPDDDHRRTKERHGTEVGKRDKEDGGARLPADKPSDAGNWQDEVGRAAVAVDGRNVAESDKRRVRGPDGASDTERDEVPAIVTSDAGRREEAVVVTVGYTVPAQWTVV